MLCVAKVQKFAVALMNNKSGLHSLSGRVMQDVNLLVFKKCASFAKFKM